MNANLTKLISSAAAVLAVGGSAFAQTKTCPPAPFEQGYGISNDKFPAAYNAAARIDVQNSWDVFLTGSFIYMYAEEVGLDLAIPQNATTLALDGSVVRQSFDFKPGFKVGLGLNFDFDNWVAYAEYTWLHETTTKSISGNYVTNWIHPVGTVGTPVPVSSMDSKWHLNMDMVDLVMSRPFYQGRKLTVLPFGGVRGAWIRQSFRINATPVATATAVVSHNQSHNWAVGPHAGCQGHWLLGCGFRMEGDMSGSVLFTRFTKVSVRDDLSTNNYRTMDYNTVRPMVDMNLGLGWGSYFDRQNYHFDLLATYDFSVLWGQNMMYALNSLTTPAADLHLQGLTITARFDF